MLHQIIVMYVFENFLHSPFSNLFTVLENTATENFEWENVVYPLNMPWGLFTVAAIDNININPILTTAKSSSYGTAASLHQKVKDLSEFQSREREFYQLKNV